MAAKGELDIIIMDPESVAHATSSELSRVSRDPVRRAAHACRSCRRRKVRCDVAVNGSPCTNCQLDEFPCVVVPRRHRNNKEKPSKASKACEASLTAQTPTTKVSMSGSTASAERAPSTRTQPLQSDGADTMSTDDLFSSELISDSPSYDGEDSQDTPG